MKNKILVLTVFAQLLFGCGSHKLNDKINGVWVFESKFNNLFIDDNDGFGGARDPIIYDFKKNGVLHFNDYGNGDKTYNWTLNKDSILTLDSLKYKIIKVSDNSLSLLDNNEPDSYTLFFHKPKKVKLKNTIDEIEQILVKNKWTLDDSVREKIDFEYLKNGKLVLKYKIFDRSLSDSTDNIQLENWKIIKYRDYHFLASINEYIGQGVYNQINQLTIIDSTSFTILDSYKGELLEYKMIQKKFIDKKKSVEDILLGKWISNNSGNKTYGRYTDHNSRVYELYKGDLSIEFNESEMLMKIDKLDVLKYNWLITMDGETLIQELPIDNEWRKGSLFYAINLLNVTQNHIKARLFDNIYYTESGFDLPKGYYVNIIQELERKIGN